jgi:hypothetical protein
MAALRKLLVILGFMAIPSKSMEIGKLNWHGDGASACPHVTHFFHKPAVCRNPPIHSFTGDRIKFERSLTDQHLSMSCVYKNIRRGNFLWINILTEGVQICGSFTLINCAGYDNLLLNERYIAGKSIDTEIATMQIFQITSSKFNV